MRHIRAVLVDDEQPAREFLRALLAAWPTVQIVGEAADGPSAIRLITAEAPDLVFLDVQMPGASGFDVLAALEPELVPTVVFTTAFDSYALRAFEVSACDYLLKPFDASRLERTMRKLVDTGPQRDQDTAEQLRALLAHLRGSGGDTLVVKSDGRHLFLRGEEIEWIEAVDKHVRIHVKGAVVVARESMNSIEQRLDPTRFVRVQRSAIINRGHIGQMQPWFKGDFVVVLRSGARVVTGRTYRTAVQRMMGQ